MYCLINEKKNKIILIIIFKVNFSIKILLFLKFHFWKVLFVFSTHTQISISAFYVVLCRFYVVFMSFLCRFMSFYVTLCIF